MNRPLPLILQLGFCSLCTAYLFILGACQSTPSTPELMAKNLAGRMQRLDPKGSGVFYESTERSGEDQMIITYRIARVEDQDDPWSRKRAVHFIFLTASQDPKACSGWYLDRVTGDYLERLHAGEGLQFDWEYDLFNTSNGTRDGIAGITGISHNP